MNTSTNTDVFHVAVVGTGAQGSDHRIPALRCLPNVRVVAVVDTVVERAKTIQDRYYDLGRIAEHQAIGYQVIVDPSVAAPRAYASLGAALQREHIDGVMVVTPHGTHEVITLEAFAAGKHVFVDKPTAATIEEAVRMVDAAAAAGLIFTVGYQNAFATAWLLEQMAHPAFGTLAGGHGFWLRSGRIPAERHFYATEKDGVIPDLGGHVVTPIVPALGADRIVGVTAVGSRTAGVAEFGDAFKAFDTARAKLHLASGGIVVVELSWALGVPPTETAGLVMYGDNDDSKVTMPFVVNKGLGYVPDRETLRPSFVAPGVGTIVGPLPWTHAEMLIAQARNWIAAAQGTEKLVFTGQQALTVERVVDAMQRSANANNGVGGEYIPIA